MAGHSKWANIQHRKGRQDKVRSKLFSKLSRDITVAAKSGLPDPAMNPRLRLAVTNARAESMPKDNIERAIKRGTGEIEGAQYEELTYEGYGPGGVAVIVEALTDNGNRTTPEIRRIFRRAGVEERLHTAGTLKDLLAQGLHDGSIDESDPCVGQICDAASTAARDGEGPLIGVEDLHEQLMTNLSATKGGLHFEPSDVVVASIHGQYRDLPGDATIDACAATSDPTPAETTCATSLGVAYSGSRYDRFLRTFAQFYPPHPADPQAPLTGWMCQGDFRPILDPTHPSSFSANTSVE